MTYLFENLGSKEFEHLVQALSLATLGPRVSMFGSGPDGGREATWDGNAVSLGTLVSWDGYGVVQAKFQEHSTSTDQNLKWAKRVIRNELVEWHRPDSKRERKPDFLLFAMNARISAVPGSGKDELIEFVRKQIEALELPIRDFRVWDYDDLSSLLDGNESIRRRFAAFTTPGDLLSTLLDSTRDRDRALTRALYASTAKLLLDESPIGLMQAGATGDGRVTIADVFVDLPYSYQAESSSLFDDEMFDDDIADIAPQTESPLPAELRIAARLIETLNRSAPNKSEGWAPIHSVLVGGPGQGKSTITQWLSQVYRAEFLAESKYLTNADVRSTVGKIAKRAELESMPKVQARRWPFRIVLTEFADFLAENRQRTLLDFIAKRVCMRSSVEVKTEDIITWLERYPWVLFIDGLDEVPVSSNRDEVIRAIRDFFVEAEGIEADVVAIATTRPQGYNDEFSSQRFAHIELVPLKAKAGLRCAQALLDVRFGENSSASEKIIGRLKRASHEEATMRLFTTPLQVTILTVLLEKFGKAPRDRSRLFAAYFQIISSREQEKSGPLSELLQTYESDIAELHRKVGFLLQERGSGAGETSSTISRSEFSEMVREQFESQGHEDEPLERLISDFSTLVTDRLVFLTYGQAERLGFELRSLQEFMAAEFIVNHPEAEVPGLLYGVSRSSFWRNVALFAIGSIFANRQNLRAEVVLLCTRLNREAGEKNRVRLGSDLATDVLHDGSCLSMPRYARELAAIAFELVLDPGANSVLKLAQLRDDESIRVRRSSSRPQPNEPLYVWINRAILCAEDDSDALDRLISELPEDFREAFFLFAWKRREVPLLQASRPLLDFTTPWKLIGGLNHAVRFARVDRKGQNWFDSLDQLNQVGRVEFEVLEATGIGANYTALQANRDSWKWILELGPKNEIWQAFDAIASFAVDPTPDLLVAALAAMANEEVVPSHLGVAFPWALTACFEFLRNLEMQGGKAPQSLSRESLSYIRALADSGELGSAESWARAEEQTAVSAAFTRDWVDRSCFDDLNPLNGTRGIEVPLSALRFTVRQETARDPESKEIVAAIKQRLESSEGALESRKLIDLAHFLLWVQLERSLSVRPYPAEVAEDLHWVISNVRSGEYLSSSWLSRIAGLESGTVFEATELDRIGRLAIGQSVEHLTDPSASATFMLYFEMDPSRWGALALALATDPKCISRESVESYFESPKWQSEVPFLRGIEKVWRITNGLREGRISGLEGDISESVGDGRALLFGLPWWVEFIEGADSQEIRGVLLAFARVVASTDPDGAERFCDLAWKWSTTESALIPVTLTK